MQGPGSDLIPYVIDSFTADANANLGPGTPRTVTIQGTIPANSYGDKSFGAYSDTVSITITP
jgi:spore coat protein U-like protein